ncbi:DUF58 domain-containing protein [soil metagenome]
MNQENRDVIREIRRRIVTYPIVTRWRSSDPASGNRKGALKDMGGFEFVGQSPFVPGDNYRDVDWVTSLPGTELVVNRYRDFHPMKLFVLAYVGSGMSFGTQRVTKKELAAEVAGSAITSVFRTQDSAAVIAYNDHDVVHYTKPGNPRNALVTGLNGIINSPVDGPHNEGSGLVKAISCLPQNERCLVFLIMSYKELEDQERRALKFAIGRHDVRCVLVQDLRERELPQGRGIYTLESIATGERRMIWLSDKARAQFAGEAARHHAVLTDFLEKAGAITTILSTEMDRPAATKTLRRLFGEIRRERSTV